MPDLGTSGYGISLNKWYRSSAAHNLLVVDSKRQARCGGYLISYENDRVTAGVKDGYPGVDIRREMSLLENGANDRVWAESDTSHRYDLFYHIRGSVKQCSIPLQPAEPFKNANGYNSLRQIRKGTCTGALSIEWTLRDVPGALSIDSNSAEPFEVYVGLCPDNPADLDLSFLMLRSEGKRAEWKSTIRVKEDSIK